MAEFWGLSPAQTVFILNAGSEHKVRKGDASDLRSIADAARPRGG